MTVWHWEAAKLVRDVDGDTLLARLVRPYSISLDIGFHATADVTGSVAFVQRLRLNRINCPPLSTAEGKAAAARATELLQGALVVDTVGPYKYGDEWMAEIVNAAGVNVADQLVAEGHALPWSGEGLRPGG